MPATMLDELLRLKVYREDKAQMSLVKVRLALAEVTRRSEEAREALARYQRWSVEQETGLYEGMFGRLVRLRQLERLREDVVILRMKERALADSLAKVESERGEADTAVRDARLVHEQASRTREKLVELVNAQSEEIRLADERKEDVETEDLYTLRRDREEWWENDDE